MGTPVTSDAVGDLRWLVWNESPRIFTEASRIIDTFREPAYLAEAYLTRAEELMWHRTEVTAAFEDIEKAITHARAAIEVDAAYAQLLVRTLYGAFDMHRKYGATSAARSMLKLSFEYAGDDEHSLALILMGRGRLALSVPTHVPADRSMLAISQDFAAAVAHAKQCTDAFLLARALCHHVYAQYATGDQEQAKIALDLLWRLFGMQVGQTQIADALECLKDLVASDDPHAAADHATRLLPILHL